MTTDFYVYVYTDCTGVPFYVGKGHGHRYKIWDHLGRGRSNPFLQNKIRKIGIENVKIDFPLKNVSEIDALVYEELFIGVVGRRDQGKGPLCNLSSGGASPLPSEETRRKISNSLKGKFKGKKNPNYGKLMSLVQRAQISATLKGRKPSSATVEKIKRTMKGNPKLAYWKGKKMSAKTRRKMSESAKHRKGGK